VAQGFFDTLTSSGKPSRSPESEQYPLHPVRSVSSLGCSVGCQIPLTGHLPVEVQSEKGRYLNVPDDGIKNRLTALIISTMIDGDLIPYPIDFLS
jgi:hypothetical protein